MGALGPVTARRRDDRGRCGRHNWLIRARITKATMPTPKLQPINFFSTGSSGSAALLASSSISACDISFFIVVSLACKRRLHAAEEQPGDQETNPDHKSEQTDEIDRRQSAEPLLPHLAEIRQHANREERQDEKDDTKHVRFPRRLRQRLGDLRRGAKRKEKRDCEYNDE